MATACAGPGCCSPMPARPEERRCMPLRAQAARADVLETSSGPPTFGTESSQLRRKRRLLNPRERLRQAREYLVPIRRDRDEVFDPNADVSRQVHPRLHRHDVARLELAL